MQDHRTFWQRTRRITALAMLLAGLLAPAPALASDHDDGEEPSKGRSRNLTDLFVFREGDQTGNAADNSNLIFIMNTNPRSVARQQYFFSSTARYEFHVGRVADRNTRATGEEHLTLRFEFSNPNTSNQQTITMTLVKFTNGTPAETAVTLAPGLTTGAPPGLGTPNQTFVPNSGTADGQPVTVFAGLREDPFFFDVEQYFRVRAFALGKGPAPSPLFRTLDQSVDFAKGYNVNAIVVRVPIALLAQGTGSTIFDVWETISIP